MRLLWLMIGSSCSLAAHGCAVSVEDFPVASGAGGGALGRGIGETCATDEDCKAGLLCYVEHSASYTIPHGMCTQTCNDSTDCPSSASCLAGYCLLGCDYGDGERDKCLSRNDLACVSTEKATPPEVCIPHCLQDAHCGPGQHCHPGNGLCFNGPVQGAPPGSPCDADDTMSTCRGWCEDGTCRESCTVKKGGCALDPDWTGFTLDCVPEDGGDFGDGGNCLRPCSCDDDCATGSVCGQTVGTQRYCIATGVGMLCR